MMRGFSGLQGNFWSKHIKFVDFWGWWNAGGPFQPSNCLFWTPSVWSWFAVHKHTFLGIETFILSSGTLQEYSLHALCLLPDFPLQPLLLARETKQSQGTEKKQSKGVWVVGPSLLITGAEVLTWCESCLRLCATAMFERTITSLFPF